MIFLQFKIGFAQHKFRELVKLEGISNYRPWLPPLFGIDESDMSNQCREQKKNVIRLYIGGVGLVLGSLCSISLLNLVF